jgi:hypothetical protein
MPVTVQHSQEWNIGITPDDSNTPGGGLWPHMYERGALFQPDVIRIHLKDGWATINIGGAKIKQDGTPSKLRTGHTFYNFHDDDNKMPEWAAELIRQARWRYGLQDEQLPALAWKAP